MNKIGVSLSCLLILLVTMSCRGESFEDYAIRRIDEPFASPEIAATVAAHGLKLERFSCKIPKWTQIRLSTVQFMDGDEISRTSGSISVPEGMQEFLLSLIEDDGKAEFSFKANGAGMGITTADLDGYIARTTTWMPIEKLTATDQTVFLFAADAGGEIVSAPREYLAPLDVATLAGKYDYVMVVSAALIEYEA